MNKTAGLAVLSIVVLLAACQRETAPAAAPSLPAAVIPAPVPVATPLPPPKLVVDPHFSVTPATFRRCDADKGAITAKVAWDFSGTKAREIGIFVETPGSEAKLWMGGGPKGAAQTGPWVYDGTILSAIDMDLQEAVGQVQVKATPCP
ncbi:hypothetical protein [Arenimonas oryziterrae]|uniref:C-type lysozyme inhibitor domain-containing protein n=1 Tax=Arenimonas oryziterrae DSM 21050 = YC6267 TaxID=1121015 RepID=A0A091AQZ6_9GAMM|nr:hypothetical protein [Arenimonas oryziterrae]KFN41414.1 hypothetical protein N789_05930 [Arenimonas oryziterrae DSM 21050 = YC6267]